MRGILNLRKVVGCGLRCSRNRRFRQGIGAIGTRVEIIELIGIGVVGTARVGRSAAGRRIIRRAYMRVFILESYINGLPACRCFFLAKHFWKEVFYYVVNTEGKATEDDSPQQRPQ